MKAGLVWFEPPSSAGERACPLSYQFAHTYMEQLGKKESRNLNLSTNIKNELHQTLLVLTHRREAI